MFESDVRIPLIAHNMTDYSKQEELDMLDGWLHNVKRKIIEKVEREADYGYA